MIRFFTALSVLSLAAVVACASDDGAAKPADADGTGGNEASVGATRMANDGFDTSCCQRRELDLNRDGRPDAYQFTKVVDNEVVVLRKEVDINFDQKIDLVRNLNEKGLLLEERLDTDFDGKVDLIVHFENGKIVKKENDTNFDGKVDMWRFFSPSAGVDTLTRQEADLNYDGKVDYWEYFEGGKLDRVGIDRDSDGNVDEWIRSQEG